jgi:hypothetical protein
MKSRENQGSNLIYRARDGDDTDRLMSEFLCDYSKKSKMKIMFLRESEGVYRFGKKRVYIKVEKGNKILVKVGGGFLKIEDFI